MRWRNGNLGDVLELVCPTTRTSRTAHGRVEVRFYDHADRSLVVVELEPRKARDVAGSLIEQARHAEAGT